MRPVISVEGRHQTHEEDEEDADGDPANPLQPEARTNNTRFYELFSSLAVRVYVRRGTCVCGAGG